jgi:BirA family biotin operon repressor/biotin-[acetyl-CoA-carboxylase] ligase
MPRLYANRSEKTFCDSESGSEFDLQRIASESFLRGIVFRRRIDSTNNLAIEWATARRGSTPLLVLAEEQIAGRGRGTNCWWSARGALTFSLVLDSGTIALRAEQWPRVSLAAAVAVCEVLELLVPNIPCGIRWPNDVDLAGRKVCGILPELPEGALSPPVHPSSCESVRIQPGACSRAQGSTRTPEQDLNGERDIQPVRFVLGVGINVNNSLCAAPPQVQAVGTSLLDLTGRRHDLTDLLLQLLRRLSSALDALAQNRQGLYEAWSRRCLLRGQTVELDAGPLHVRGLCRGVDTDGALVIETHAGLRRFLGGRVQRIVR